MSFNNALQKQAEVIDTGLKAQTTVKVNPQDIDSKQLEKIADKPTPTITQPIISLDIVTNKNRLDLFFSLKPSDAVLSELKYNGWRYRASDKAWFHFDCETHRQFIREKFNLVIDSLPVPAQPEIIVSDKPEPDEPEKFTRYKQQINELLAHLKIDCADLQLLAIDTLHKKVFSQN